MPLTPADFRCDITGADLQRMRRQERDARVHHEPMEFTITAEADPCLAKRQVIRLEMPVKELAGLFLVLEVTTLPDRTRYQLLRTGATAQGRGEKLVRLID